jgi:CopG family transcriptional regulator/antitoxin EndoAI
VRKNVRTSEVISITLPPKLLREAERLARKEGRTRSELFREALRRYLAEQSLRELQRYGAQQAKKLGVESDEDVLRLIQEYRQEQRQKK